MGQPKSRQELLILQAAETTNKLRLHADPKRLDSWDSILDDPRCLLPATRAVVAESHRRMGAFRRSMGRWYRRNGMHENALACLSDARYHRRMARELRDQSP